MQSCQNCFLRVQRNTFMDFFLKIFFIIFFGTWSKLFLSFGYSFLRICQSWSLYFQRNTLIKYFLFRKILFRFFSELWANQFLTFGKIITESLFKLYSTCSGNTLRKQTYHNFLVLMFIRASSESFPDFWKFLYANLWKLLCTSSDEDFDEKNLFEKLVILF